jgi:hypothetical protein
MSQRVWTVVHIGWNKQGQTITLQNVVQSMEQRPSRVSVDYLIRLWDNSIASYPSIREVVQILAGTRNCELDIDGDRRPLSEWRTIKDQAIARMKALANWGNDEADE